MNAEQLLAVLQTGATIRFNEKLRVSAVYNYEEIEVIVNNQHFRNFDFDTEGAEECIKLYNILIKY